MITGILSPDEGTIEVDGVNLAENSIAAKSRIGFVPDNQPNLRTLKGIEYLNFIGTMYGVETGALKARISEYAEMFQLSDALPNMISSYSHGMKQKLVIISALVHSPKLLILDEPFVGLDPEAAFKLKNVFKEMCEQGSAIFFSTHVLDVAEKLCNKIAIIKGGKIIASGNIEEVRGNSSLETVFMEILENK